MLVTAGGFSWSWAYVHGVLIARWLSTLHGTAQFLAPVEAPSV
ncbi:MULTISPECIES: hypothetical protein [Tsukamurella]|uniref:Uncharacterized protein n=1 Tax=Tsukamurella strandjordii TaxID=147577 RepID=A0AA90SHX6_9ACTN|nr:MULTISPECIES: hypothetical protein [Tsukamurella]MDP0399369.1 hypothetical protein [Tsukamurella strandjordii]